MAYCYYYYYYYCCYYCCCCGYIDRDHSNSLKLSALPTSAWILYPASCTLETHPFAAFAILKPSSLSRAIRIAISNHVVSFPLQPQPVLNAAPLSQLALVSGHGLHEQRRMIFSFQGDFLFKAKKAEYRKRWKWYGKVRFCNKRNI